MVAILEIYFARLLLNLKANLSGNQVSDRGSYWPSCNKKCFVLISNDYKHCTSWSFQNVCEALSFLQ